VLTITSAEASRLAERAAPALFKLLPHAVGITNSFDLTSENAIMGRRQNALVGEAAIEEEMEGVRYRVSGESFFQVNVEIVQRIFDFIRPELTRPQAIVDLYCGAGTFSLFFAKHGATVFGIEESAQAVAEAQANADLNGMQSSVHFRAGRVEDAVRMPDARDALRDAGIVFLDPPRKGSDERTLGAIAAAGAPRIWYLSCDPATLARDLKFLAAHSYRLELVQPFDMFPQTGHIEALVMLRRTTEAAGYGDGCAA
jgi:23S rRNA (uracil1939-C5)-methyltransferase